MYLKRLEFFQTGKSFNFSLSVLKKPQIFQNASHNFEKASSPLNMYLKSLAIFEKPPHLLKEASISLKISLKCHAFLK
jgi:hypothetical protein